MIQTSTKHTLDDLSICLSQHYGIYFPNVFLVTVFSHFLHLIFFKRKTGWASQNSIIQGINEATSDDFPEESAKMIQCVHVALAQLNVTGLIVSCFNS